jgi:regulator of cell morphogenesis and NO signaling
MPVIDPTATVAQITLEHPACALVFRDHRIDFCCRGALTVQDACAGKGIDAGPVFAELERAVQERGAPAEDPRDLATAQLIEHIVTRHHRYLRKTLPFVEQLARKVARVHGEHDAKLPALADLVAELRATLEPHLDDEERSLFTALTALPPDDERIARELGAMHDDHLRVGEMLTCMRTLADDYSSPDWACGSYRTLMRELEALELDTLRHVHVENHVLMARFAPKGSAAGRQTSGRGRSVNKGEVT